MTIVLNFGSLAPRKRQAKTILIRNPGSLLHAEVSAVRNVLMERNAPVGSSMAEKHWIIARPAMPAITQLGRYRICSSLILLRSKCPNPKRRHNVINDIIEPIESH